MNKFDKSVTQEKLNKIILSSKTKKEVCEKLRWNPNAPSYRKLDRRIKRWNINISHFTLKTAKWIKKICPICEIEFETKIGKKEKTTCSKSCAVPYFKSGPNHPNWNDNAYRSTCFYYHKKICIICDEKNTLEVHHYDKNRNNNNPENLIPLCPTHHRYMHTKYKDLIEDKIIKFINDFKNGDST